MKMKKVIIVYATKCDSKDKCRRVQKVKDEDEMVTQSCAYRSYE